MGKSVYIAEKPSVAQEFAKALHLNLKRKDGYLEAEDAIVTWCVGHLVTMSYPEAYDEKYKRWSLSTLPFIPKEFKYEVIPAVKKQFDIVKGVLTREDVERIYVCTDSGREGEYIYRLVEQMAQVEGKERRRVWIDSQTEEEILRGIREAKDLSEYDNLSESAYLRAKEDYLMGINFSRLLTLKYGNSISNFLGSKYTVISVGRVMTCVLGMVVRREREIREFVKTPFYRIVESVDAGGHTFTGEWRAVKDSRFFESTKLYKENGFKTKEDAEALIRYLKEGTEHLTCRILSIEKKKEKKNPPLLFNLAELQNECSKRFKISPDETLRIVQELYEKKLVTYPRTDARVLSTAVAKEITKNLNGLSKYPPAALYMQEILHFGSYKGLAKTRYVNDKQITDHYAIIPTGQGLQALQSVSVTAKNVYDVIVRRFLSIFYPPAVYQKVALTTQIKEEQFFSSFRVLAEEGYLKVSGVPGQKKGSTVHSGNMEEGESADGSAEENQDMDAGFFAGIQKLKKGDILRVEGLEIKEGETSPPKRYNSGSMILAMENAGQLIEDEELRAQIKGSGIGTSATRAEILKKLFHIKYLALNKKTQVITPTLLGEMIYDVVQNSIRSLLNPELTASWEKGLNYVADGEITSEEYMTKLDNFIVSRTNGVLGLNNQNQLRGCYERAAVYYKKEPKSKFMKGKGKEA